MEDLATSGIFIGLTIVILSALSGAAYYQTRELMRETSAKTNQRNRDSYDEKNIPNN